MKLTNKEKGIKLSKVQKDIILKMYSNKWTLAYSPITKVEYNLKPESNKIGENKGVNKGTISFLEILGYIERDKVNSVLYEYKLTPDALEWIDKNKKDVG